MKVQASMLVPISNPSRADQARARVSCARSSPCGIAAQRAADGAKLGNEGNKLGLKGQVRGLAKVKLRSNRKRARKGSAAAERAGS